jgi:hypothetical protein
MRLRRAKLRRQIILQALLPQGFRKTPGIGMIFHER